MENMRDSTKERKKKTKPNKTYGSDQKATKWNHSKWSIKIKHNKEWKLDCEELHTYGQCVVQMQNVQIRTHSMPRPKKKTKIEESKKLFFA